MKKVTLFNEGVDHIWVNAQSKTGLGRISVMNLIYRFDIPNIGTFTTPGLFAVWVVSGLPMEKIKKIDKLPKMTEEQYKMFRHSYCLGKYFQLQALNNVINKEAFIPAGPKLTQIKLPFVDYRIHKRNGLKELLPDQREMQLVKAMIKHMIDPTDGKAPFKHEDFDYITALVEVNKLLKSRRVKIMEDIKIANTLESIHQAHESLMRASVF